MRVFRNVRFGERRSRYPAGGQKISPAIEPGFFLALRSLVQWQLSRYGFVKSVNVDRAGPGDNRKPQNLVCVGAGTAPSRFLAGAGQASAGRREMWARPAPQTAPNRLP